MTRDDRAFNPHFPTYRRLDSVPSAELRQARRRATTWGRPTHGSADDSARMLRPDEFSGRVSDPERGVRRTR
jgi:hypothetical protein